MPYNRELETAIQCAKKCGDLQQEFLTTLKDIELKSDKSPVTIVDKKCESLIKKIVLKEFPDDGFLGEETGLLEAKNQRRWIVDPIDGTRPYIHGIPTYSTLIALEENNRIVIGVIHFAGLKETYWASIGGGAYCNDRPIHVSDTGTLDTTFGSSLGFLEKADTIEGKQLFELMKTWDYCYGYMDAYSYAALACGKIDIVINLLDKAWDCAAAACIIKEAGGTFSDINGIETIHSGNFVATNDKLHSAVLASFDKGN